MEPMAPIDNNLIKNDYWIKKSSVNLWNSQIPATFLENCGNLQEHDFIVYSSDFECDLVELERIQRDIKCVAAIYCISIVGGVYLTQQGFCKGDIVLTTYSIFGTVILLSGVTAAAYLIKEKFKKNYVRLIVKFLIIKSFILNTIHCFY